VADKAEETDMTDSSPTGELALIDRRGDYAVITINRPEKRNAMNLAAQQALREAMVACRDQRVIVITGTGPAFCSGIDLVEAREERHKGHRRYSRGSESWFEVQEEILRHPAVFIAAVNGFALGGGLTLVNNCELAVASEGAEFGMPEMGFGSFPGLAGPSTIHRILPKHAAQMIFTAQRVDAATALKWGIVNEVTAPERLLARACELAEHIAQFNEVALDFGKRAYRESMRLGWSDAIEFGIATNYEIRGQSSASDETLKKFAAGHRGEGQGSR
jgi:enoyl-CoA hydratase/carnithine racemase